MFQPAGQVSLADEATVRGAIDETPSHLFTYLQPPSSAFRAVQATRPDESLAQLARIRTLDQKVPFRTEIGTVSIQFVPACPFFPW
jgi:hypothetical protein